MMQSACHGGHTNLTFRLIDEMRMTREEVLAHRGWALRLAFFADHVDLTFRLIDEMKVTKNEAERWIKSRCVIGDHHLYNRLSAIEQLLDRWLAAPPAAQDAR